MYKRILLKISGEALMGDNGPIGFEKVEKTARSIAALAEKGIEVGVVVGGGNIIRGRDAGQHDRNRRDHMGMLATAINALALQDAFEGLGKKAAVLSAVDMDRFCDSFSSRRAKELLSQKVIRDNLKATDLTAITLCREQELPILCFALERLEEAVECENVGTLIDSRP